MLYIQLRMPLSEQVIEDAKKRLADPEVEESETIPSATGSDHPLGKAIPTRGIVATEHGVKLNKTEDERKKIFYDLLKAVDDYGITPEGRNAWLAILRNNNIDAAAALDILAEGFGTFSDWEQPGGDCKASSRMNRITWIGTRTRTHSEPMLQE